MRFSRLAVLISVLLYSYGSLSLAATYGVSIGAGNGTKQVRAQRINLQRAWGDAAVTPKGRKVAGFWELGFTRITSDRNFSYNTNGNVFASTAAVVVRLHNQPVYPMFIDLGLGVSYLSKKSIATRQLGSNFLFEERLGVGLLFGRKKNIEVGYRFTHFSNAYLAQKNNGLNLHLIVVGYWF
jgi:lipid A 3-O-deacylase